MAHKNKLQFTIVFTISPEHVEEGDKLFNSHAEWMERTHHKTGEKALLTYDVSKAPEMENPMDPNSGKTGNTVYVLSEVYESPTGLADHWQQADASWKDFKNFKDWMGRNKFILVNGSEINHSLW